MLKRLLIILCVILSAGTFSPLAAHYNPYEEAGPGSGRDGHYIPTEHRVPGYVPRRRLSKKEAEEKMLENFAADMEELAQMTRQRRYEEDRLIEAQLRDQERSRNFFARKMERDQRERERRRLALKPMIIPTSKLIARPGIKLKSGRVPDYFDMMPKVKSTGQPLFNAPSSPFPAQAQKAPTGYFIGAAPAQRAPVPAAVKKSTDTVANFYQPSYTNSSGEKYRQMVEEGNPFRTANRQKRSAYRSPYYNQYYGANYDAYLHGSPRAKEQIRFKPVRFSKPKPQKLPELPKFKMKKLRLSKPSRPTLKGIMNMNNKLMNDIGKNY